jgi:hypothetical protein
MAVRRVRKMDRKKSGDYKEQIFKEANYVIDYVGGFEVHSARDEQALAEILSMLAGVRAAIERIEASHQRRIELMGELARTLGEMENQHQAFADRLGKKSAR